jgi:hypothetical protein
MVFEYHGVRAVVVMDVKPFDDSFKDNVRIDAHILEGQPPGW